MAIESAAIEVKPGSAKNFGITFSVVFAVIGIYPFLWGGGLRWWSLGIAAAFLLVALFRPVVFTKPNYLWFRFGLALGAIVAPIVMALVYVATIVPIGLIFKVLGKDPLHSRFDTDANSYWIEREDPPQPMKNQF